MIFIWHMGKNESVTQSKILTWYKFKINNHGVKIHTVVKEEKNNTT